MICVNSNVCWKRAKHCVFAFARLKMDQLGPQMDQKGLKIVLLYQNIFFAEHTFSEEIVLNEISMGGRFTIIFALA